MIDSIKVGGTIMLLENIYGGKAGNKYKIVGFNKDTGLTFVEICGIIRILIPYVDKFIIVG